MKYCEPKKEEPIMPEIELDFSHEDIDAYREIEDDEECIGLSLSEEEYRSNVLNPQIYYLNN